MVSRETSKQSVDVEQALDIYTQKLETHPIKPLCDHAEVPKAVLEAFARAQFVDSTMWVAMLSLIKGHVSSTQLRDAVRKNILDEVGDAGTPHVTLCKRFVESLGVPTYYSNYREYSPASVFPVEVMMGLAGYCDDATIAGWLLSQENLVPVVFRIFRRAYATLPQADLTYLTEHEEVDSIDHARWIREAIEPLIYTTESTGRVISGIDIGGRTTISVLDFLYAQTVRLGAS